MSALSDAINAAIAAHEAEDAAAKAASDAKIAKLEADLAACQAAATTPPVTPPPTTTPPAGSIVLKPGDDIGAKVNGGATGATFYFQAGVYRGVSLAPKSGQTFIGAAGAIINGSIVLTGWVQSGNLWMVGGQTQQLPVHPGAAFILGTQRPGYRETVYLDNVPLKPVDALSKVVAGTFYLDYTSKNLYIATNPAGHTVEAGRQQDAFHPGGTGVTIQGLVVEKYCSQIQDGALRMGASWIVKNCEARLCYGLGISVRGDSCQVINNYIHDNGEMGTGGVGNNVLVQGNEIARNGIWSYIDPLWEAGGCKFSSTDNLILRGNYSHDNTGSGLWTDINNIHTLYENNILARNTINGISHEISYDAVIRNNTFWGNGAGDARPWAWGDDICIQNSQNVDCYGNRVEMTGGRHGIMLIQQNRGTGTHGVYAAINNKIHDNIIVDHDTNGWIGGVADYNHAGMWAGGNIWTNNKYFMADGNRFAWKNLTTNFAAFKSACGETGTISQTYPDTSNWPKSL